MLCWGVLLATLVTIVCFLIGPDGSGPAVLRVVCRSIVDDQHFSLKGSDHGQNLAGNFTSAVREAAGLAAKPSSWLFFLTLLAASTVTLSWFAPGMPKPGEKLEDFTERMKTKGHVKDTAKAALAVFIVMSAVGCYTTYTHARPQFNRYQREMKKRASEGLSDGGATAPLEPPFKGPRPPLAEPPDPFEEGAGALGRRGGAVAPPDRTRDDGG